jgi:thiol-disulfide isomerase/thioredoxin
MSELWIAALLSLWLIVALLAFLVLGLLRRIAPILERAEAALSPPTAPPGLPVGSSTPPFELMTADGRSLPSANLLGRPFVLLFVSSGCAPCRLLAERVREVGLDLLAELIVVADETEVGADVGDWPSATLAYQRDHEVSHAFATSATPHAFAINRSGTIVAAGFPNTLDRLQTLAGQAQEGGDLRAPASRHGPTRMEIGSEVVR